jgi:ribosomal protein L19E
MDAKTALQKMGGGQKKSNKPKGLPKRTGKRAAKYQRYFTVTRPRRKILNLLRSNGRAAAKAWADAHGILYLYTELAEKRG